MRHFVLSQVHILTHYVQLIYISVHIICINVYFEICPQFNCVLCKIRQFIMLSLLWRVVYVSRVNQVTGMLYTPSTPLHLPREHQQCNYSLLYHLHLSRLQQYSYKQACTH